MISAKRLIQRAASAAGLEIRRTRSSALGSMEHFLHHLRRLGFAPKTILDVGANKATWSSLAASFFPSTRFILIEPQEEMLPHLQAFCQSHPTSRLVLAGAGATPEQAALTIWDDLQGSSFLPEPNEESSKMGRQRVVQIVTVDSLMSEKEEPPDLAKLDVQGFELEVLSGASRLFGHTECFILEISLFHFMPRTPSFSEVVSFMRERGYDVYDICGYARRPFDHALGQVDLAFAKAGGFLRSTNRWA